MQSRVRKIVRQIVLREMYLYALLITLIVVSGILCAVTRLTAEQFLQVVFAVLGFIGGTLYERLRTRITEG